ncbi:MAG: hydrogenase small subunit, partial [Coriobacteriia bacterium]|nr:hydrogenase small subunit [Coriobacteriia bacterium]
KGEDGNTLRIADRTGLEILEEAGKGAAACIAVGSCAVDGGWVAARPNPAQATGVKMFFDEKGITTPVINLPTCPVNPEWVVAMVVDVLLLGELESGKILKKLDDFGRPKGIFGQSIHDNCPRRGHFENGEFVYEFGSQEEALGYCLYALGCKGPQTFTNCPIVRWNRRASWCVEAGSPCIGCGNAGPKEGMNWVDVGTPFLNRHPDIPVGGVTLQPTVIGAGVGAAAAAALIVHGIGMKAAGRMDGGTDYEEMKEYDRKKGGGK